MIHILRHGEAETGKPDAERRLTVFGKNQIRGVLRLATRSGVDIDSVLSSPLVRAKESAKIASTILGLKNYNVLDTLEPETTPYELYRDLKHLKEKSVLLVSHQPLVSRLLSDLLGSEASIAMPTGSFASIQTEGEPMNGSGTLFLLLQSRKR